MAEYLRLLYRLALTVKFDVLQVNSFVYNCLVLEPPKPLSLELCLYTYTHDAPAPDTAMGVLQATGRYHTVREGVCA